MWLLLLVGVAVFLGLSSRRSAARERRIVIGVAVLTVGYLAASKHLL
jgi:hypothetical protein